MEVYSGGLSWVDQWDPAPDPPPSSEQNGKSGKKGSKAQTKFKKWINEIFSKKSNK